jgi:hypothetical protein
LQNAGAVQFKIGVQRCHILLSYFQNGLFFERSQAYTKFRTLSDPGQIIDTTQLDEF